MNLQQELTELVEDGHLKPETVVEAARNPHHALHPYFTWDDTDAAQKFRIEEARGLIRSVYIETPKSGITKIRAFVSLTTDRVNGEGYRVMAEVVTSDTLRLELIRDIENQVKLWERRAKALNLYFNATYNLTEEKNGQGVK